MSIVKRPDGFILCFCVHVYWHFPSTNLTLNFSKLLDHFIRRKMARIFLELYETEMLRFSGENCSRENICKESMPTEPPHWNKGQAGKQKTRQKAPSIGGQTNFWGSILPFIKSQHSQDAETRMKISESACYSLCAPIQVSTCNESVLIYSFK